MFSTAAAAFHSPSCASLSAAFVLQRYSTAHDRIGEQTRGFRLTSIRAQCRCGQSRRGQGGCRQMAITGTLWRCATLLPPPAPPATDRLAVNCALLPAITSCLRPPLSSARCSASVTNQSPDAAARHSILGRRRHAAMPRHRHSRDEGAIDGFKSR